MATIDFPVELPKPLRSGYAFQHTSPFARTEMSTGRARQRRTFQYTPSIGSFELHLTTLEAQVFEAWFKYDITDGADWFNLALKTPVNNTLAYECRFTSMYSGPTLSALSDWEFSFDLELRERVILTQAQYDVGNEFILGSSIIDIALNSKWPAA